MPAVRLRILAVCSALLSSTPRPISAFVGRGAVGMRGRTQATGPSVAPEVRRSARLASTTPSDGDPTRRPIKRRKSGTERDAKAGSSNGNGPTKDAKKAKADKKAEAALWSLLPEKERKLLEKGFTLAYGIDEAGRGPLAGPVVAAACHVPLELDIPGLQDSKAIGEEDRERIYEQLVSTPGVLWAVEAVDHTTIDEINILQASMLAMQRALQARLEHHTAEERGRVYALVDGNRAPDLGDVQGECVIKGDSKIRCIAAASIIAKVTRDRHMLEMAELYPEYEFHRHKGYPTAAHRALLAKHGPCPIHRMTFAPIRKD